MSTRHLVPRPFIRCSGRLFPRQWHAPHVPQSRAVQFLSPDSSRSGKGSVSRHISATRYHFPTPFKAGFGWLFIPCLVCIWLTCQEVELGSKQALLACQVVLQQTLQTSFEETLLRYGLRQLSEIKLKFSYWIRNFHSGSALSVQSQWYNTSGRLYLIVLYTKAKY